jgi:Amt family ammonium transporter
VTGIVIAWLKLGKPDISMMLNGALGALVAITAASGFVAPWAAIVIGIGSGFIAVFGVIWVEKIGIDDPIGAVAVHGACGIFGTISLGLFATGQYGLPGPTGADNSTPVEGLFYGGGTKQLFVQIFGSAVVTVSVFLVALVVMYAVKALGILRVSEEVELGGIDIHEHGAPAYHPEFAYMGHSAIPSGGSSRAPSPGASATPPIRVGD